MKKTINHLMCSALLVGGPAAGLSQNMNTAGSSKNTNGTELATFGGGCFWCAEAIFQRLDGVQVRHQRLRWGQGGKPDLRRSVLGSHGARRSDPDRV